MTRIATQGRQDAPQWVTSYKLAYSTTGATYSYVSDDDAGGERVFAANSDQNTIVEHALGHVMLARFVRVYPQAWQQHCSLLSSKYWHLVIWKILFFFYFCIFWNLLIIH